jgi:hypothetical protein
LPTQIAGTNGAPKLKIRPVPHGQVVLAFVMHGVDAAEYLREMQEAGHEAK